MADPKSALEKANLLAKAMDKLKSATEAVVAPFGEAAAAGEKFATSLGATSGFKGFAESALQVDNLRANLEKATGASDAYLESTLDLQDRMSELGISLSESEAAVKGLFNGFSEFTLLAPDAQKKIEDQVASFTRLGISVRQSTKSFDTLIKGMGMTADEATNVNRDMAKLAKSIGVAPAKMSSDFTSSAKVLARYGKEGISVFKELAVQSKATGLSMNTLIDVAGKFDTFQGAADAAGNLNAILGGNLLNSVDMLTASESERINMIRQAMNATGQSFEMMGRFEKKAIAGAVGITDMTDAMRLFGTEQSSLEDLEKKADPAIVAQQNLTKAMEKGTKLSEKFMAAFERLSRGIGRTLQPIIREFATFITGKKGLGAARGIFDGIAKGIKAIGKFFKSLSPEFKKTLSHIGQMVIKGIALSAAIKGVQEVASPLMSLLSNRWVTIIAGAVGFLTHLDRIEAGLKKVGEKFKPIDGYITNFFAKNKQKMPWLAHFEEFYGWMKDGLPQAVKDFAKLLQEKLGPIWEQFSTGTGIFEGGMVETMKRWWGGVKNFFSELMGGFHMLRAEYYEFRQLNALGAEDTEFKRKEVMARLRGSGNAVSDEQMSAYMSALSNSNRTAKRRDLGGDLAVAVAQAIEKSTGKSLEAQLGMDFDDVAGMDIGAGRANGGALPQGKPVRVGELGMEEVINYGGALYVNANSQTGGSAGQPIVLNLSIDGKEFAAATYEHYDKEQEDRKGFSNLVLR